MSRPRDARGTFTDVHGQWRSPTYQSWACMIQRCENPNHETFDRYGARGIRVCQRWRDSFLAFLTDMGERPAGMSIDRIDNDGDYTPDNCRWATPREQMLNASNKNREKTRCLRGHPFTEGNFRASHGRRFCLACHRLHDADYRARQRAKRSA